MVRNLLKRYLIIVPKIAEFVDVWEDMKKARAVALAFFRSNKEWIKIQAL